MIVEGLSLTIDAEKFFFRYENPTWLLCDWVKVRDGLLPAVETGDSTIEQMALDFVTANGYTTRDPQEVLLTAHEAYAYVFRDEHADDPELDFVPDNGLRMLREYGTIMALNRVELDGHVSNACLAWMLDIATELVYGHTANVMDEIYHGVWFNEYRRRESVLAHAALGGRLVHGYQGAPNMSASVVVPFGADIDNFRKDLSCMRLDWIDNTRNGR